MVLEAGTQKRDYFFHYETFVWRWYEKITIEAIIYGGMNKILEWYLKEKLTLKKLKLFQLSSQKYFYIIYNLVISHIELLFNFNLVTLHLS